MSTGLDAAAGVAGLIAIGVTVFEGCVRGFMILATARQISKDGDLLRCMIEWEHYRLYEWAQLAGITSGQIREDLNWALIVDLLQQLQVQLDDTEKLRERYGLELTPDEKEKDLSSLVDQLAQSSSLQKLTPHLRKSFLAHKSHMLHEKNQTSPLGRLRWAIIDKDKLTSLLDVVRKLIRYLWDVLALDDRKYVRNTLDLLLRDSIAQTNIQSDIGYLKELASPTDHTTALAGQLRQVKLDVEDESSPTKDTHTVRTLARSQKVKNLKLKSGLLDGRMNADRLIVKYDDNPVLVEIKNIAGNAAEKQKILFRAQNIAILLNETVDESFHTLKCMGYISSTQEILFIFELPRLDHKTQSQSSPSIIPTQFPLDYLILTIKPDLQIRIKWCVHIAEAILQLHTAGWLHKSIRPDSIIWIQSDQHCPAINADTLSGPYLCNFAFSREMSPSAYSGSVDSSIEDYCFRHPDLRNDASKPSFRARYDVYALGLVLICIGLWLTIEDVTQEQSTGHVPKVLDRKGWLEDILKPQLAFKLPRKFVDAVMMALRYDQGAGGRSHAAEEDRERIQDDDPEMDEDDTSLDVQQSILSNLRGCL